MTSQELRKKHIKAFLKLSISERLNWSFQHQQFLLSLMDPKEKQKLFEMRRQGKKYL